jgi:hypothetical protein
MTEQVGGDISSIVPATSNGILVIVNKSVNAKITFDEPAATACRVDQLMFIRTKGDAEPMTPSSNNGFAGSGEAMEPFLKVCYGHGVRTNASGATLATAPGQAGTPDEFAANWVFTRHAMFFKPSATAGAPASIHAEGAWYDAATTHGSYTGPSPQTVYMGALDVAELGLASIDFENGAMFGVLAAGATGANVAKRLFMDDNDATYASKALDYTFATERIRVNTSPVNNYAPGMVAQMHSLLATGVIEFAVAFAGDYDGDGLVDTVAGNAIKWYDAATAPPTGAAGFDGVLPHPISQAGGAAHADQAFVFRHGSGETRWPQMIRIRYRLVDAQGRLASPDGGAGRAFELVARIPN